MTESKKGKSGNGGGAKGEKASAQKPNGSKQADGVDKKTSKNDKSVKQPVSATSTGKSPGAKGNKSPKSGKKSPKGTSSSPGGKAKGHKSSDKKPSGTKSGKKSPANAKSSPGNSTKRHKSTASAGKKSPKGNSKSSDKKPSGSKGNSSPKSGKKSPKGTKSSPGNKTKTRKSTTSAGAGSRKGNSKSSDKKPSGSKGKSSPKSGKKSPKGTKSSPGNKAKTRKSTTNAGVVSSAKKHSITKGDKPSKSGKKSPGGTKSSSDNKPTNDGEKSTDKSKSAGGETSKHEKKSKQKPEKIIGEKTKEGKKNSKENSAIKPGDEGGLKDDSKPSNDKKQDENADASQSKEGTIAGKISDKKVSKKNEKTNPQNDKTAKRKKHTDKDRKKSVTGKGNKPGERTADGDKESKEKGKKDNSKGLMDSLPVPSGDAREILAAHVDDIKKPKMDGNVERRDSTESIAQDEPAYPKNQNAKTWSSTIQGDSPLFPGNTAIVPPKITPPRANRETEKVYPQKEKREAKKHAAPPASDLKSTASRFCAPENQATVTRVRSSITNRYPIIPGVLLQTFSKFGIPGVNITNLSKSKASAGDSTAVTQYMNEDKTSERTTTNEHLLYGQSYASRQRNTATVVPPEPTYNLPTQSPRNNFGNDKFRTPATAPQLGYAEPVPQTWNKPRTPVDSSKFCRPPNVTESMTGQCKYKRMYGSISQRNPQLDSAVSTGIMDANNRLGTEPISMYDKHINLPDEPFRIYDKRVDAPQQVPQYYDNRTQKTAGDANVPSTATRSNTTYSSMKVAPNVNGDSIYDRLNTVSADGCVKGSITNRFPYMQPNVVLSAANSIDQSGRLALAISKSGVQGEGAQRMLTQMGRNPGRIQQSTPLYSNTGQQQDARPRSNSVAEKVFQIQTETSSDEFVPHRLRPNLDSPNAVTKARSVPQPEVKFENHPNNVQNNKSIRRNSVSEKILQFQPTPPRGDRDMDNTSNGPVSKPPKATKNIMSTQDKISSLERPPVPVQAWAPRDPLKDNFINISINIDKNNANQNTEGFKHSSYFSGDTAGNKVTVNHPGTMINVASNKPPISNYFDAAKPQNSSPFYGSPYTHTGQTNWNTNARHSNESLKSCSDEATDLSGQDSANSTELVDLSEREDSTSQKPFMRTRTDDDDIMGNMQTVVSYAYQLVNALCSAMEEDIQKQLIPTLLLCDRCPGDEPCVHSAAEAMSLKKQTTCLMQEVSDLVRPQITLSMVQTTSARCRDIPDVYEKLDGEIFKIVHTVLFEVSQSTLSNLGKAITQHMVKHSSLALKKTKFMLLEDVT